jgi:hypothetical protein
MLSAIYVSPAVFAVAAVLLGSVVLFFHRIHAWVRVSAFCALLFVLLMLWQSSLGLPRPTMLELHDPQGTVVSYVVNEPDAILVWLVADGSSVPRSYALPFDTKEAMQLQQAFEAAKKNGLPVRMGNGGAKAGQRAKGEQDGAGTQNGEALSQRGAGTDDRTSEAPMFYTAAQRADPLKADTRVNGD